MRFFYLFLLLFLAELIGLAIGWEALIQKLSM
nr:MAG TPA: hypothetical protein [Caudoviricetes sp.]